jgi:predicted NBD/HSP70 family sugar kinase
LISIINNINILLDRNRVEKDKLKAIVIGAPGVYDSCAHRFLASRISNWHDIDAEGALQVEYNTPVIIKNDIGMAALGEYVFGLRKSCSSMIYINADSGIGAGLILDGQLYEGKNGAAGLISGMAFSKDHIGGIYKRYGLILVNTH